jgi:hypothetical protein
MQKPLHMVAPAYALGANRFGRAVTLATIGNTSLHEELSRQGLARIFTRYRDRATCERWEHSEAQAREARQELWSMPNAIPPWEFRRGRRWRLPLTHTAIGPLPAVSSPLRRAVLLLVVANLI